MPARPEARPQVGRVGALQRHQMDHRRVRGDGQSQSGVGPVRETGPVPSGNRGCALHPVAERVSPLTDPVALDEPADRVPHAGVAAAPPTANRQVPLVEHAPQRVLVDRGEAQLLSHLGDRRRIGRRQIVQDEIGVGRGLRDLVPGALHDRMRHALAEFHRADTAQHPPAQSLPARPRQRSPRHEVAAVAGHAEHRHLRARTTRRNPLAAPRRHQRAVMGQRTSQSRHAYQVRELRPAADPGIEHPLHAVVAGVGLHHRPELRRHRRAGDIGIASVAPELVAPAHHLVAIGQREILLRPAPHRLRVGAEHPHREIRRRHHPHETAHRTHNV